MLSLSSLLISCLRQTELSFLLHDSHAERGLSHQIPYIKYEDCEKTDKLVSSDRYTRAILWAIPSSFLRPRMVDKGQPLQCKILAQSHQHPGKWRRDGQTDRRTDRRTDRQMDGIAVANTALAMRVIARAVIKTVKFRQVVLNGLQEKLAKNKLQ